MKNPARKNPARKSSAHPFAAALPAVFLAASLLPGGMASARPLTPAEQRELPYTGRVPDCGDPLALNTIRDRFGAREAEYWNSGLAIAGYDGVSEIGLRSAGLDLIPRRYCKARAIFADGRVAPVYYNLSESMGWLGAISYGLNYCIVGYDRSFAYGSDCQAARP